MKRSLLSVARIHFARIPWKQDGPVSLIQSRAADVALALATHEVDDTVASVHGATGARISVLQLARTSRAWVDAVGPHQRGGCDDHLSDGCQFLGAD